MKIAAAPTIHIKGVPMDLMDQLSDLENWAQGNQRDARLGTVAFWLLKGPAIAASASAGILAQYQMPTVSLALGFLSSFCMLIDSIQPRGALRNTHLRAFHDIRNLTNKMATEWRSRKTDVNEIIIARQIVADSEKERSRIAAYVSAGEVALGAKAPKD